MAINPLFRSSPTRMMGLSSGLDTESIIQQTLKLHQMKIDTQMRQRTTLQWKQGTYNSIKSQITSFRNTFLSSLGANTMMQSGSYNSTVAVMNKDSSAFSIKTMTSSSLGTMKIGKIESLAKGASVFSTGSVSSDKNGFISSQRLDSLKFAGDETINFYDYKASVGNTTVSLSDLNTAFDAITDSTITFNVNGAELTLTKTIDGNDTKYSFTVDDGSAFKDIELSFDSEGKADIPVGMDKEIEDFLNTLTIDDGKIQLNGNQVEFSKKLTVGGVELTQREDKQILHNGRVLEFVGSTNVNINGKEIALKSNMTLSQMLSTINNTKDIGATISYDRLTDKFKLESKTIGSEEIEASDETDVNAPGNALNLFGLAGSGSSSEKGSKAVVYINNERVESDKNTFEYRGVGITLRETKGGSEDNPLLSDPDDVTVTFKRDASEAINKIKGFIEAYNSIIKKVEDLVRERKTSGEASYGPLTDEEKSSMTEKQIEEWETIAKKGILKNDSGLQNLAATLRSALYETVKSAGLSPSEIGLGTGNFFSGTGGQIVLDENKLRAALEEDPERVSNVFAGTEDNKGLLWRMNNVMGDYVNKSQTQTLKNLENSIKRANDQMKKMQARMYEEEDKLYKQFTAMETALSKLQSQGSWMSAMLGGGK